MKNILAENMRRFGTKNLNEQQGTVVSDSYIRVGQSRVWNYKITGNRMQFTLGDLDFTTRADSAPDLEPETEIELNNIELQPETDRTYERYTVSSKDDISITLTADSAVPGGLVDIARDRLFFWFSE